MGVGLEIDRFRVSLIDVGYEIGIANEIAQNLSSDITNVTIDIVSNATNEAIDYAESIGAYEFADDVQVVPNADDTFIIRTHSGKTDYSEDEKKMLDKLLKNAKISESGNRYKVIPVSGSKRIERSSYSAAQTRKDATDLARTALRSNTRGSRVDVAGIINASLSQQHQYRPQEEKTKDVGPVSFRTATDKQDANTQWVIPKKNADMTEFLNDINNRIVDETYAAIKSIISDYSNTYMDKQWHM